MLGNIREKEGKLDEAIEHLNKALAANPQNAEIHNTLGDALL